MRLEVLRFSSLKDSTNGLLFDITEKRTFLCYTLEDEFRSEKIVGETRIPDGEYKIELRTVGGFHNRYSSRFKDIHKGMLQVMNVEGFEYILIHCGNTDEHTNGCLIVGDTQTNNLVASNGFVGSSTKAYSRIYPNIAKALVNGEEVTINYKSI